MLHSLMESCSDKSLSEMDVERTILCNGHHYPWEMHRMLTACSSWLRTPVHLLSYWISCFPQPGLQQVTATQRNKMAQSHESCRNTSYMAFIEPSLLLLSRANQFHLYINFCYCSPLPDFWVYFRPRTILSKYLERTKLTAFYLWLKTPHKTAAAGQLVMLNPKISCHLFSLLPFFNWVQIKVPDLNDHLFQRSFD